MKNFTTLALAVFAVASLIYLGIDGINRNFAYGAFFTFIGVCTSVGLVMDITNHIKSLIRKSNLRKLQP